MHIPQIGVFEFSDADIVRNPLISIILERLNGEFK
jgi:phosphate starvation-inducible protein PhoH